MAAHICICARSALSARIPRSTQSTYQTRFSPNLEIHHTCFKGVFFFCVFAAALDEAMRTCFSRRATRSKRWRREAGWHEGSSEEPKGEQCELS